MSAVAATFIIRSKQSGGGLHDNVLLCAILKRTRTAFHIFVLLFIIFQFFFKSKRTNSTVKILLAQNLHTKVVARHSQPSQAKLVLKLSNALFAVDTVKDTGT